MLFYFVHYVHIRVLLYINYQSAIPAEISTAHPPHPQPPSNPSRNFSRALRGPGRVLGPLEIFEKQRSHGQLKRTPSWNANLNARSNRISEDEFQSKKTIMLKTGEHKQIFISPH